jgi:hypothetical protein
VNEYEQIRDYYGVESNEQKRFMAQYERQQKAEEELFTRAPRTKEDKKREKRLKSSSGLHELTENFYDDIKFLDKDGEKPRSFGRNKRGGPFKKRKVTFFLFYYFFLKYSAFFCFCFSVSFVFDNVLFNFRRQGTDMDTPVVPLAASVHQFCCHEKDTNFRFAFMIKC